MSRKNRKNRCGGVLLIHSGADPAINLAKKEFWSRKKINDDYQFKSCIIGEKAGLLSTGRS
jgi:hypothetical protein